ncbi:type VI lipase adapter Tla3 domain-containing protein, partial [Stenotrophomonas maltophilia]|uniref:type VI lipase adapter Tla3 domain-containing protein n=1 Tax=Stenotrophomonas maltophilia TaxID=40324 RepID=UPI0013DC7F1E
MEELPGTVPIAAQEVVDRDDPTWSLEIRGVGMAPGASHQTSVWKNIREKGSDFASIYSQDPLDYTDSEQWRRDSAEIRMGAAFKYAVSDAVAYWPIPTFAVEPPNVGKFEFMGAAGLIDAGRFGGSLGVTLFLWQQDANTTRAQPTIEKIYNFFDENPEPPAVVLAVRDGEVMRDRYSPQDKPLISEGHYVPSIIDTTAVLTLARSDRVDRYLRPYAP